MEGVRADPLSRIARSPRMLLIFMTITSDLKYGDGMINPGITNFQEARLL
jgi:hypothetical protein